MTSSKCPYRCKHQLILLTVYRSETLYITQNKHGMLFTSARIPIIPNSPYNYGISVVICGGLHWPTRLATGAANHHKPPPKCRKYAGFRMMGIRESIVLHRQGSPALKYFEGANPVALVAFSASSGVSQGVSVSARLNHGIGHKVEPRATL